MGCYGIGINRILAAAIEIGNDEKGCILPISIAPFEIEVLPINNDSPDVVAEAERIYRQLVEAGADVLLDDRNARPGVKFNDADLIGVPLRLVVGDRSLREGDVEIKRRREPKPTATPASEAVAKAMEIIDQMKQELLASG
ncbi:MAG: proline--tRNA ligase, partial [Phycisphaerae bacterium]|nr:proline--tRNA ligase [Phycisphaerae bacterium]